MVAARLSIMIYDYDVVILSTMYEENGSAEIYKNLARCKSKNNFVRLSK